MNSMKEEGWGAGRARLRSRRRRTFVSLAIVALLALPVLMALLPQLADISGLWIEGRISPTIPLAFWAAEIVLAGMFAAILFRSADELERASMRDAASIGGGMLVLLLPPAVLTSGYLGWGVGDAVLGTWAFSVVCGLFAYAIGLAR